MTTRDQERISLYLDGGMEQADRGAFERELEARPDLAMQVDRWRMNDGRLRAALDVLIKAEMLARLGLEPMAPAHRAEVIDLAVRKRPRIPSAGWLSGGAMAASIAALAVFAVTLFGRQEIDPTATAQFQLAMQQLPSLQKAMVSEKISVTPTLSFADSRGKFCREFMIDSTEPQRGVACRSRNRWRVEGVVASPAGEGNIGQIRTAAGADPAGLDPIYDRLGAGDPFNAAQERQLIAQKWRENSAGAPE